MAEETYGDWIRSNPPLPTKEYKTKHMTPKEKAKELYDMFYEWYPKQDAEFIAEQSVIAYANEMINNAEFICVEERDSFRMYWQDVKKEIEKL